MALTPDQLVERRRMQRRLSLWRALAFAAVAFAVLATGWRIVETRGGAGALVPHVARLSISGVITGDEETIKLIDDLARSRASAAVVEINSPGGTVTGSERIYEALRRLSAKMPTVAVVRDLAASGGYIAAIGTDHIVAQDTSLVGSIGVLFQFPNFATALDKLGIKVETIKSSPLKASPNGFEPTSPAARAAVDALVVENYTWFKGLVKDRRKLDDSQLAAIDDGRVFTARQGIGLHLVDGLGEERDAIRYLEAERHVTRNLPVLDWKKQTGFRGFGLFSGAARLLGLDGIGAMIDAASHFGESRSLDGLLAIWQGPGGT